MKFCCSYKVKPEILDQLDEIRYSSLTDIFSIREKYAAKRIIYEILEMKDIQVNTQPLTNQLLFSILDDMPNLYIDFYSYGDLAQFMEDSEEKYNNRAMYHYPVDGYNMLNMLLAYNVSDITITEPLTFDIENVSHYIRYDNPDCKIRMRPYIGREAWAPTNDDMCHFWVLPQHLHLYDSYVDVIDLLANSVLREEALYNAYKSGMYGLDMNALIEHFDVDPVIKGGWIDNALALRRLNCRQICQSTKPKRCHICDIERLLAKYMPRAIYQIEHPSQS